MHDVQASRSAGAPPLLQINAVEKTFDAANGPVQALRGINLDVRKGEFRLPDGRMRLR
jgi:NitT/TauT family transport system ATP-binding protein/sulfonate transport system ATP-binding protein